MCSAEIRSKNLSELVFLGSVLSPLTYLLVFYSEAEVMLLFIELFWDLPLSHERRPVAWASTGCSRVDLDTACWSQNLGVNFIMTLSVRICSSG